MAFVSLFGQLQVISVILMSHTDLSPAVAENPKIRSFYLLVGLTLEPYTQSWHIVVPGYYINPTHAGKIRKHQAKLVWVLRSDCGVIQDVLNSSIVESCDPLVFGTVYQGNSVGTLCQVFLGTLLLACTKTLESGKEKQVWSINHIFCTNIKQDEPLFCVWDCWEPSRNPRSETPAECQPWR